MLTKDTISNLLKSIAFSPNNQQLIASDGAGSMQAWEVPSVKLVEDAIQKYPQASSLATSSEFLALGATDKINILDIPGDGVVQAIDAPGGNTLLALNKDGSWLASTDSSGKIQIWKTQDGKFTSLASLFREQAESLAFNPDGFLLAVGTAQNVFLIDTVSGKEIARIPYRDVVTGVAFSPDGMYLTTVSSNVLQRWEISKLEQIKSTELLQTACSRLIEKFSETQFEGLV